MAPAREQGSLLPPVFLRAPSTSCRCPLLPAHLQVEAVPGPLVVGVGVALEPSAAVSALPPVRCALGTIRCARLRTTGAIPRAHTRRRVGSGAERSMARGAPRPLLLAARSSLCSFNPLSHCSTTAICGLAWVLGHARERVRVPVGRPQQLRLFRVQGLGLGVQRDLGFRGSFGAQGSGFRVYGLPATCAG